MTHETAASYLSLTSVEALPIRNQFAFTLRYSQGEELLCFRFMLESEARSAHKMMTHVLASASAIDVV